jgi:N-acetylmuramoyl-L-alanine amidase
MERSPRLRTLLGNAHGLVSRNAVALRVQSIDQRFSGAKRGILVHIPPTSLSSKPQPTPPKAATPVRQKAAKPVFPPLAIRPAKLKRIAPSANSSAAKQCAPIKKPFRFVNLVPFALLLAVLIGLWVTIPKGEKPATPVNFESLVPVIVVDAGHGGNDNGATRNGLVEKQLALDTALRLERLLKKRGFTVVLTRNDDRFLELYDRAQIANQYPRALFVSIHFNDSSTATGEGVETFYAADKVAGSFGGLLSGKVEPPPADNGAGFAQAVQKSVAGRLGALDRGTKARQLAVVRHTRCPAILVEGGFINNPLDARKLKEPTYRERLADAICEGVVSYHNQRVLEASQPKVAKSQ